MIMIMECSVIGISLLLLIDRLNFYIRKFWTIVFIIVPQLTSASYIYTDLSYAHTYYELLVYCTAL